MFDLENKNKKKKENFKIKVKYKKYESYGIKYFFNILFSPLYPCNIYFDIYLLT